jgi:hypothetical protein
MKKNELFPARGFMKINGADPVPIETLTKEQWDEFYKKKSENISKNVSAHYAAHPEQYKWLDDDDDTA